MRNCASKWNANTTKKHIPINEYFYECRRQRLDNNVIDKTLRRNSKNKKTFLMQQTIHPDLKKV